MRSILLAFALVLVLPATALAAGTLTVAISGAGAVSGSGIECTKAPGAGVAGPCSVPLTGPATVTAAPAAGFRFEGWTGACEGTAPSCELDMDGDRSVAAGFRDIQPPVVTLAEPLAGSVKGPMPISAEVTDNGQIEKVEFKVGTFAWVDKVAPYSAIWPTVPFPDGPVPVTATAYDKAGNFHTKQVEVLFDNTAPVVGATGPDRQAFAPGSTQTWQVTARDATSSFETRCSVVPQGSARVIVPCTGGSSHSVSGLPVGRYEFVFAARDAAGNYAETVRLFRIETPGTGESAETTAFDGELDPAPAPAPEAAAALAAPATAAADAPPKIAVALGFRYASLSRATKLSNFVVRGVPAGATVTVSCVKGCTKKALKRFVKRAGRISLKALARRPLKVDTTITVIVSKPGHTSAVKVLEIRARKAPLVTTQCQPEGASEPSAC
ncbi:MAG TPA: Ig-like domain-containing protein [Thermoleophilaceae bacterium]|nr:Ig-like domain-containing protein [Thermoleophilaceae bacterium]